MSWWQIAASKVADKGSDYWIGRSNAQYQRDHQAELMVDQQNWNAKMYKERYYWTVKDMKSAGINPIMAASGGFSVGNAPTVSLPSPGMPNQPNTGSFSSTAKDYKSIDDMESQIKKRQEEKRFIIFSCTRKIIAEAELARKKSDEALANVVKMRAETKVLSAEERLKVQQVMKTEQEVIQTIRNIVKIENEIENIQARTKVEKEREPLTKAQRQKLQQEMNLVKQNVLRLSYGMQELIRESNVYKGPIGGILVYIREILKAIGLGIFLPFLKGGVGKGKAPVNVSPSYLKPIN